MSDQTLIDIATQKIVEQGFNPATARAIAGIAASVFMGDASTRKDDEGVSMAERSSLVSEAVATSSTNPYTLNMLPCPFCGEEASICNVVKDGKVIAYTATCDVCNAELGGNYPFKEAEDAARNWNIRKYNPSEIWDDNEECYSADRLKELLDGRDTFIVDKGLSPDFVVQLSSSSSSAILMPTKREAEISESYKHEIGVAASVARHPAREAVQVMVQSPSVVRPVPCTDAVAMAVINSLTKENRELYAALESATKRESGKQLPEWAKPFEDADNKQLLKWAYLVIENFCPHVLTETVEGRFFEKRVTEIEDGSKS